MLLMTRNEIAPIELSSRGRLIPFTFVRRPWVVFCDHGVQSISGAILNVSLDEERPDLMTSAETVRERILDDLCNGRLAPGQRLIEPDLVKAYGAGRAHVREALRRLHSDGIVDIVPNRGAMLRSPSPEEARDIGLTLIALMALAARQATKRISPANRELLQEALREVERVDHHFSIHEYASAREHYARALITASGNREVERLCPVLYGYLYQPSPSFRLTREVYLHTLGSYQELTEAVLAGDADRAEDVIRNGQSPALGSEERTT
jgi:DNA-binding GntR family transcriptional regulator